LRCIWTPENLIIGVEEDGGKIGGIKIMRITEKGLKRLVRAMNSVLNLYDVEEIPEALTDALCEPVEYIAGFLKVPTKIRIKDGTVDKYIMPENFDEWLENNGKKIFPQGNES